MNKIVLTEVRPGRGQIVGENVAGRLLLCRSHFWRSEAAAGKINARCVPSHTTSAKAPARTQLQIIYQPWRVSRKGTKERNFRTARENEHVNRTHPRRAGVAVQLSAAARWPAHVFHSAAAAAAVCEK